MELKTSVAALKFLYTFSFVEPRKQKHKEALSAFIFFIAMGPRLELRSLANRVHQSGFMILLLFTLCSVWGCGDLWHQLHFYKLAAGDSPQCFLCNWSGPHYACI